MVHKGEIRDRNLDYLLKKIWIPAIDVVKNVGTLTAAAWAPATLSVGWSVGSPSYSLIDSSRVGGIKFSGAAVSTSQVDYFWRVPSEVDKNHPIYFRHHWTYQGSGLTPTIQFNHWYATLSLASSLFAVSPTTVLNTAVPASSNTSAAGTGYGYNITGRGVIAPIGTGLAANQIMQDTVEALHVTFAPGSANFSFLQQNIWWLGMDIEYTPRLTYGDGSRREGRKMETNIGFQEIGAAQNY